MKICICSISVIVFLFLNTVLFSTITNKLVQIVQEALDAVQMEQTSITIAHRLSTIKNVDKIFVIEVQAIFNGQAGES